MLFLSYCIFFSFMNIIYVDVFLNQEAKKLLFIKVSLMVFIEKNNKVIIKF